MEENSASVSIQGSSPTCHLLPLGRRIAYSVGHVLNDLCASLWFSYLLIYQHSVLQFSNKIAGGLLLLGQVADAVATPFVGIESDRRDDFWLCRYGKRKTWHLVGTICVAVSFPFLFMKCVYCSESSQQAQFVYYGAFIVIFQFGWASTQISHLSLIPDLTPISSERVELNALRYAMTVMSNICVYSTLWLILGINSGKEEHISPQDADIFRNVALIMVAIGLFFSMLFHVFVKEKPHQDFAVSNQCVINKDDDSIENKPHLRWKDWFKQPQFYMVGVLYMATRLYVNLSQVYFPLYIQDSLQLSKDKIAIIPLVIYVSGFLSTFFMKFLNKKLGNKITYFIGCILALSSSLWLSFGEGTSFSQYQIYAVAVLVGIAGSTLLIISLSFTSDLISNSTTSGAFVFGAMSFLDKLSNGIAVVIIQDIHPCIYCCSHCKWYYQHVLVFACGGAVILGLLALATLITQSVGVRRNEDLLSKRCAHKQNRRTMIDSIGNDEDAKPLLLDDDDDDIERIIT